MISLLALTALVLPTAASALAKDAVYANAQETQGRTNDSLQTDNRLIAPQTYEEYLLLTDPACVAVCENYTAIADENVIYVFDRDDGVYKTYVHGTGTAQDDVKKMQFWGGNTLYFADNSTGDNFYKLSVNAETLENATELNDIACGTFLIAGDDLYFTNPSGSLYATTLQDAENNQPKKALLDLQDVSALAYWGDELYFVQSKFYLHKLNPALSQTQAPFLAYVPQVVSSMTVSEGVLSYVGSDGSFYAYSLADVAEVTQVSDVTPLFSTTNDGYKSVYPFGEYLYLVQSSKGIVKEFSIADKNFTDFEISSNSSADHRLSESTDVALFKDTLYIADNGNSRLSAYDTKTQTLTAKFPLATQTDYLATDGECLIAASATEITLYSLSGDTLASFNDFNGNICGVASVYGVHYALTESNYFYAFTQTPEKEWVRTEVKKTSTHPPQMLTADAYGNLYIKSGAYAYVFDEATFMLAEGNGEKIIDDLPVETKKISVDYEGNFYALHEGVSKYQKQTNGTFTQSAIDVSERFVYGNSPTFTSFAFGIEQNATYMLCNGNYIFQTNKLALPTVTEIPVENADERIFAEEEATFEIVKTKKNALLIAFDVQTLKGADVFPYLHYLRSGEERQALKIGEDESGKYNLIAHFDQNTSKYSTYLVLKSACETLPNENYRIDYAEGEQKTAWLTNSLSLYKFPYLCEQLIVRQSLPRGAQITLLGEIGELDHAYYRIAYVDENGQTKTGYIPQSYATLFDASPKDSAITIIGEKESDRDSVWRLAYILLGVGAICILTDYLIFRKKKREDE